MKQQRIHIAISDKDKEAFQRVCEQHDETMSRVLRKRVKEIIKTGKL